MGTDFKFHLQIFNSVGNEDNIRRTQKRIKVTGPTEHYYLNVRQANNTKQSTHYKQLNVKQKRNFLKTKMFLCLSFCMCKKGGKFFSSQKKKERRKREEKKLLWLLPTYHPPSPGRDVVAELPFDGAF